MVADLGVGRFCEFQVFGLDNLVLLRFMKVDA